MDARTVTDATLDIERTAQSVHDAAGAMRVGEQNLRSAAEVLGRAFEISAEPATAAREPADRVVGICWHFAVLYAALLGARRDRGASGDR